MSRTFFQKVFPGRPAGRGAPRLPGFGPSRRRVRYYTRPRRPAGGKPARTQDAANSSAVKRRWSQAEGGVGLALRPAPHARPPGRPTQPHASSCLYIGRKIGHASGPEAFRAVVTQAALPPVAGFPLFTSAKLLAEGIASRKKNGRLRARPPSVRAIPSATAPGRFSMSEGFHHFDIEEAKVQPPIRMLKHFHRVRSYTCMPNRPWPRS